MTNKPKKTLDKVAEAVINNDLKTIKKLVSDLHILGIKSLNKLSGINQFGEPYYLIAKRLGYNKLSEFLYQHTSEDLINKEYLTSPVQVLYNLVHVTKKHKAAIHKALEEYAFNPLLAKLLIPIALNNIDKTSLAIIDMNMDSKLKKALNEIGVSGEQATHFDFSPLIDRYLQNKPIPSSQKIIDGAIAFYNKTGTTNGIVINNFEGSGPTSVLSLLGHELLGHAAVKIVFKGTKSLAPYSNEYGQKCSKKTYVKAYSVFEKDLKFIKDYIPTKKDIVERDGEKIITIDKNIAPNGKELIFTMNSVHAIFNFLNYQENEDQHGEAIAFYTQTVAMEAPNHYTTAMGTISEYSDTCIVPAIEEFASSHPNCHLLQGIGACATQNLEL